MIQVDEQDVDKITAVFHSILKGKTPVPIELPQGYPDNEIRQAVAYINNFIAEYNAITTYVYHLGRGEINADPPKGNMIIGQSLKAMQSSLRNLTWTTKQIAAGDFSQRVSFMGEFSEAFNSMAQQLQASFREHAVLTQDLQNQVRESDKARKAMLNIMEDLEEAKQKADAAARERVDHTAEAMRKLAGADGTASGRSAATLDMTRIQPLLERLAAELAGADAAALYTVQELLALTRGTSLAGGLQKVANAVSTYEFEKAEAVLQALTGSK